LDLESTVVWLDPTYGLDVQADGDPIGSWADRMGRVTVVQGTTAKKPTLKLNIKNGMPVIRCDGANDFLQGAMSILSQPFHMFVVTQSNVVGAQTVHNLCVDGDDVTNRSVFYRNSSGADSFSFYWGNPVEGPVPDTDWHIFTGLGNGGSSEIYMDGNLENTANGLHGNSDGMTIGSRWDGALNWDGDIGDVIICDPNLSAAERVQVETWLSNRWDIALA
jgi:hypothetical protein